MLFSFHFTDSHALPKETGTKDHMTPSSDDHHVQRSSKVRGVSFPQEYDLARLTQDVENFSRDTNMDVENWGGVTCGKQGVIAIDWSREYLSGSLNWKYLPSSLECFEIWENQLSGEVPFQFLPVTLKILSLSYNEFSGTPNFLFLPPSIEVVNKDTVSVPC